jgi:hypothetical protein
MNGVDIDTTTEFGIIMAQVGENNVTVGSAFASYFNWTCYQSVYNYVPKGVDASKEIITVTKAWYDIQEGLDTYQADTTNGTAYEQLYFGINAMGAATLKTLFDTFSVTVAKRKMKKAGTKGITDLGATIMLYYDIFDLILAYTFIAVSHPHATTSSNTNIFQGGLALVLTACLGFLSLPKHHRRVGAIVRLAVTAVAGIGLCLVSLIEISEKNMYKYLGSAWMIPTICLTLFFCVVVDNVGLPKRRAH